jgi:hypothetical protein
MVENAAIALQEALIKATQNIVKKAKPSEKAKPWWNMEIQPTLKLTREWKLKAKQELLDTNSIPETTSKALNKQKETSETKSNTRRKNGPKKFLKKHILMTYGLSENGPKAHKTTQHLPYLEDQAERKLYTWKKKPMLSDKNYSNPHRTYQISHHQT